MTTPTPTAWAVARADALMDALREGAIFPDDWRVNGTFTDARDAIALALDAAVADERERAAKAAQTISNDLGEPAVGGRIAAAIRTPAPETDNG